MSEVTLILSVSVLSAFSGRGLRTALFPVDQDRVRMWVGEENHMHGEGGRGQENREFECLQRTARID